MSTTPHPDGGVEVILTDSDLLPENEEVAVAKILGADALILAMQDPAWPTVKTEGPAHVFVARHFKDAEPIARERVQKARERRREEDARREADRRENA